MRFKIASTVHCLASCTCDSFFFFAKLFPPSPPLVPPVFVFLFLVCKERTERCICQADASLRRVLPDMCNARRVCQAYAPQRRVYQTYAPQRRVCQAYAPQRRVCQAYAPLRRVLPDMCNARRVCQTYAPLRRVCQKTRDASARHARLLDAYARKSETRLADASARRMDTSASADVSPRLPDASLIFHPHATMHVLSKRPYAL
jgi:ferredoxin